MIPPSAAKNTMRQERNRRRTTRRQAVIAVLIAMANVLWVTGCGPWDPLYRESSYVIQPQNGETWQVERIILHESSEMNQVNNLASAAVSLELVGGKRLTVFIQDPVQDPRVRSGERSYDANKPLTLEVQKSRQDFDIKPIDEVPGWRENVQIKAKKP